MIVKKIPRLADGGASAHAQQVRNLVDYMRIPDKGSPYAQALLRYLQEEGVPTRGVERLYHLRGRNFLSETIEGQRAEMMAGASRAIRSPNPLDHWLLSWKESEQPTPEQIDEAAEIFLNHLGLLHHQAIYAAHADTHNIHLHIAVNRYDPFRQRMHKVNKGFTRNAGHEGIALIVAKQGWEPEGRARYSVVDGELRMRPDAEAAAKEGHKSLSVRAAAFEARTGLKSAQRIAIEEAAPVMLGARSWAQLHFRLAERGITYIPQRSGAVLKIGDEAVKASSAHRRCSHKKLEERLGEFKPAVRSVVAITRSHEANLMEGAILAGEYHDRRTAAIKAIQRAEDQAQADRVREERRIRERSQADRRQLNRLEDGGTSRERSVLKSIIQEAERAALKKAKEAAADQVRRAKTGNPLANDYEEWLRSQGEEYLAERWRKRGRLQGWAGEFAGVEVQPVILDVFENFRATKIQDGIRWARTGEPTAFIEWHDRVEVAMPKDEAAILAAFRLAQAKYGKVTIRGPQAFQERAVELLRANGLARAIANPEWKQVEIVERPGQEQASADPQRHKGDATQVASASRLTSSYEQDRSEETVRRELERRNERGR